MLLTKDRGKEKEGEIEKWWHRDGAVMTNNFVRSRPELLALARSAHGWKNTCHRTLPERMNAHPW